MNLDGYLASCRYDLDWFNPRQEFFFQSSCHSSLTIQQIDDGIQKPKVVPISIDSNRASYLHKDFLSNVNTKKQSGIMMNI